jgi:two-component sensor histidine kinase/PAS domain-containing protein
MARKEDDLHWLLRRQLLEVDEQERSSSLAQAVNKAYRIFDDNYLRIKLILRRKIYQLVQSNAELQRLIQEKNNQLSSEANRKERLIENLHRAEVIAHLGSFSWSIEYRQIEFSENLCNLLGIPVTSGNPLTLIRKFEAAAEIVSAFKSATPDKSAVSIENLKLNGDRRYFELEAQLTFNEQGRLMQISGIFKESTHLVHVNNRAEDQKKFYEAILNNIPVDIAIFNEDHKYLYLNPIAVRNQETRDFLLGRDDFDYCNFKNLDTAKAVMRRDIFNRAKTTKLPLEFEDSTVNVDGTPIYVLRRFFPVMNSEGNFAFMIGYGVDITKMKTQELSLEHSLQEKEALLGEVHHSVKNNLTLIVALLEINSTHEKDELVKKYFNEIRNRISAMALIYDKLYRSEVFNRISLREYIQALTNSLQQTYLHGRRDVIELDVDEIYVDNKNAVPLALLVNELVSNAFFHAFTKCDFPKLSLALKNTDQGIRLTVSDNGPGLPEGVDPYKGKTFGFKLISLFARQLKGKLQIQSDNGLHVEVLFQNLDGIRG